MRTPDRKHESLSRWAARQRRRHWVIGSLIAVGLAAAIIMRARSLDAEPQTAPRFVGGVIDWRPDSPTLRIESPHGESYDAALLGIAVTSDPAVGARLSELAPPGTRLTLSFDPLIRRRPDAAGRWRVYAYLPDARMLNELLLEEGLAAADASTDHDLTRWFALLENRARRRLAR